MLLKQCAKCFENLLPIYENEENRLGNGCNDLGVINYNNTLGGLKLLRGIKRMEHVTVNN